MAGRSPACAGGRLLFGVDFLAEFLAGLGQGGGLGFEGLLVVALEGFLGLLQGCFDLALLVGIDLVAVVGEG